MKDVMEKAPFLEMAPGMDAKSAAKYTQQFVKAPMSLHPKARPGKMEPEKACEAMTITLHC